MEQHRSTTTMREAAQGAPKKRRGDEPPANALELLDALMRSPSTTDVVVRVGERDFAMHRAILAHRSGFLAKLTSTTSFAEKDGTVMLRDVDSDAFAVIHELLYTFRLVFPPLGVEQRIEMVIR
jgi:hypothetical protein